MGSDLHFLVVDGYSKEGRAGLEAGGATTAGVLYRQMLEHHSPGCTVDILYPTDPGVWNPMTGSRGPDLALLYGKTLIPTYCLK